ARPSPGPISTRRSVPWRRRSRNQRPARRNGPRACATSAHWQTRSSTSRGRSPQNAETATTPPSSSGPGPPTPPSRATCGTSTRACPHPGPDHGFAAGEPAGPARAPGGPPPEGVRRRARRPLGISESAYNVRDLELTYQYSNFGVPGLGLERGLSEDLVIAPYATGL